MCKASACQGHARAILLSCALAAGRRAGRVPRAASGDPPGEPPHIVRVENQGLLFTGNSAGVSGVDDGYSIPAGAQTLWLFGDAFLQDPRAPARPFVGGVSNCGLTVQRGAGRSVLRHYAFLLDPHNGLARQLIPNLPTETGATRLWPMAGWYSAPRRKIYDYYAQVRVTGPGAFGFKVEGYGLASAPTTDGARFRFARLPGVDGRPLWWRTRDGPVFGAAVVEAPGSGYLYVAGVLDRNGVKTGKLARVARGRLEDPAAYQFYVSGGRAPRWSSNPADAADVPGLSNFPSELSLSFNKYLGGYLAVQSVGISQHILLSIAQHPWGPYRPIGTIGAQHLPFQKAFCYAGKEHPELAQEGGRIVYITFCDSRRYWLEMLRVTFAR